MLGLHFNSVLWIRVEYGIKIWSTARGVHEGNNRWAEADDKKNEEKKLLCLLGNKISVDIYDACGDYRTIS